MSDPNANHARDALAKLEALVVQDIFLTETASLQMLYSGLCISRKTGTFTNTDRRVQLAKKAINLLGKQNKIYGLFKS